MKVLGYLIFVITVSLLPEIASAVGMDGGMMHSGEMEGGHHVIFIIWMLINVVFVVAGLWLLCRIARALEEIAKAKKKD